jgi:hypothetical protein
MNAVLNKKSTKKSLRELSRKEIICCFQVGIHRERKFFKSITDKRNERKLIKAEKRATRICKKETKNTKYIGFDVKWRVKRQDRVAPEIKSMNINNTSHKKVYLFTIYRHRSFIRPTYANAIKELKLRIVSYPKASPKIEPLQVQSDN